MPERVIVLLPRIPEWQITTVGTLASGAIAVPTSMAVLSPRDIQHRVNHSEAVLLVATPDAVPVLDALRAGDLQHVGAQTPVLVLTGHGEEQHRVRMLERGADDVLVSRTVKDLVAGSGIKFEDYGTHTLKGIPEAWQVFRALG